MAKLLGKADAVYDAGDGEPVVLHFVMDNEAWIEIEELLDLPYWEVFEYLILCEELRDPKTNRVIRKGKHIRLKVGRALLFGATRFNHPELTLHDCGEIWKSHADAIGDAIGAAVMGSLPIKAGGDDASGEAKPGTAPAPENGDGTTS